MKTSITLIFTALVLMTSQLYAAEIPVANAEEFNTAWLSYSADDVIVLGEGTYAALGDKSITRSVTIKAAPGLATKPILQGVQFIFKDVCSFSIEGVEVYFDEPGTESPIGKYFVQAVDASALTGTIPLISVKSCVIHGFGRGMIRADNGTNIATITSLVIDDSYIYDMGRNSVGYSTIGVKTAKLSSASITNSTFYDSPNGTWNSEQTAVPVTFLMENCTLIKTTTSGSKLVITNKTNPGSTFTIRNCIIADSQDATTDKMQIKLADLADEATVTGNLENSILVGFKDPKVFGPLAVNTEIATTAVTYDISKWEITTDPVTTTSVGDPRWNVNGLTSVKNPATSKTYAFAEGGMLHLNRLSGNALVEVYNLSGSLIQTVTTTNESVSLPLSDRTAIVRVVADQETLVFKVIQ